MDPKAATLALIAHLHTMELRGSLRRALELANLLPEHDQQNGGTYGHLDSALRNIRGEGEAIRFFARTGEWPATDFDGEVAQDTLDLQEWLGKGGFQPPADTILDLTVAYRAAHLHLPVNIRARVGYILADCK